ncbi:MAG TPA: hypothetical protein VGJ90_06250 [Methylophilaceae bacterium]|jgi:hypothetical protein
MGLFSPESGKPTKGCPTDLLDFDKSNPRLLNGNDYDTTSDEDIITALNEISPIDEVITSICTNTYLDFEPLIVISTNDGRFKVLEGNRRLASIKLIKDPELAKRCKIPLPAIPENVLLSVQEVTVWLVEKETDAQSFIGFKHINGPSRWDAYAKARFVSDWYKREEGRVSIDQIARQLGDDNDTIRSYISSIYVLDQAEARGIFNIKNRFNRGKFAFSHLYTALGRTEFQEFLGLGSGWDKTLTHFPVPRPSEDKLKEVLIYLYGDKRDDKPSLIKSQNPDLKHIGESIVSPVALQLLRSGASLKDAYNEVRTPYDVFSEVLAQAHVKLRSVIENVQKYQGEESLLGISLEMVNQTSILYDIMLKKHKANQTSNSAVNNQ